MLTGSRTTSIRDFLLTYGFVLIMVGVLIFFSLTNQNFLTINNALSIMHTAAPTIILASGLALVIMTGKLDISVGSIAFLSSGISALLMQRAGVSPLVALPLILIIGILLGALNGFIVVVLRINPLITTLGAMIALRGIALQITDSRVISISEALRRMGNAKIGPVYFDIWVALVVLIIVHLLLIRTPFGRHVTAIGNNTEVASRLGVRVPWVSAMTFVLSGFFAALGGIFMLFQVGAIQPTMGSGYEFTAIVLCVIGGISLFGGEGTIIPGLILGGLTLTIIESGLNFMSASPFAYPFVRGGIIFVAMYADSLKSLVKPSVKLMTDEAVT